METIFSFVLLLLAFGFAIGTTIIVAERKERKRAEPGKFDKQGVAPYTDGDNT